MRDMSAVSLSSSAGRGCAGRADRGGDGAEWLSLRFVPWPAVCKSSRRMGKAACPACYIFFIHRVAWRGVRSLSGSGRNGRRVAGNPAACGIVLSSAGKGMPLFLQPGCNVAEMPCQLLFPGADGRRAGASGKRVAVGTAAIRCCFSCAPSLFDGMPSRFFCVPSRFFFSKPCFFRASGREGPLGAAFYNPQMPCLAKAG